MNTCILIFPKSKIYTRDTYFNRIRKERKHLGFSVRFQGKYWEGISLTDNNRSESLIIPCQQNKEVLSNVR